MFHYYTSMWMLIPAMLLAFWAQSRVSSAYRKYSQVANLRGYSGADVARMILDRKGIRHVQVEGVPGELSDHYDPKGKVVRLSEGVYHGKSLAALAIAAHECGHAMQDEEDYAFLRLRHAIVPAVSFANRSAMPLAMLGLFFGAASSANGIGYYLLQLGILLFAVVVAFHVITLPVEFNASSRAMDILEEEGYLERDEVAPAKKVLDAAALTYIAAAAVALANLLRLIALSRGNRR